MSRRGGKVVGVESRDDSRVFPAPIPCPRCAGGRLLHVIWGLPAPDEVPTSERDDVLFGGCVPGIWDRECDTCGFALPVFIPDLREAYRPEHVKILLIGESPPDQGSGDLRFFYEEHLRRADNLFRGVAQAVLGPGWRTDCKPAALRRLKDAGVWLIDLVDEPINHLPPSERLSRIKQAVSDLVERVHTIAPEGVIVCHTPTYTAVVGPLRAAGIRVLHDEPIPFPLGNHRQEFVARFKAAMARLDAAV